MGTNRISTWGREDKYEHEGPYIHTFSASYFSLAGKNITMERSKKLQVEEVRRKMLRPYWHKFQNPTWGLVLGFLDSGPTTRPPAAGCDLFTPPPAPNRERVGEVCGVPPGLQHRQKGHLQIRKFCFSAPSRTVTRARASERRGLEDDLQIEGELIISSPSP
jgi:hypothetical protein